MADPDDDPQVVVRFSFSDSPDDAARREQSFRHVNEGAGSMTPHEALEWVRSRRASRRDVTYPPAPPPVSAQPEPQPEPEPLAPGLGVAPPTGDVPPSPDPESPHSLPEVRGALLVRTDFTDDERWARVCERASAENDEGFAAYVTPVDDPAFDGADWTVVRAAVPPGPNAGVVVFVADGRTHAEGDHSILVVDLIQRRLHGTELAPFRCAAGVLWSVDNNLSIFNMDWADFAGHVGADGVFRGF